VTSDIGPEKVLVRACNPAPFGTVNHKRPQRPQLRPFHFDVLHGLRDRILITRLEPVQWAYPEDECGKPGTINSDRLTRANLRACLFAVGCIAKVVSEDIFSGPVDAAARRDTIPVWQKYRTTMNPRMITICANWRSGRSVYLLGTVSAPPKPSSAAGDGNTQQERD
jgi:hypothetical protein